MYSNTKDGLGIILGKIVETYRYFFGLSVSEFANKNSIPIMTIMKLEAGHIDSAQLRLFDMIATSIDMPLVYLISLCKEIKAETNNSTIMGLIVSNRVSSYYLKKLREKNSD